MVNPRLSNRRKMLINWNGLLSVLERDRCPVVEKVVVVTSAVTKCNLGHI